jgi:hypothetical protein
MDNNLTNFGRRSINKETINITYDAFAIPAALRRGLFEYLYRARALTILPHIPSGITELVQLDPARFGSKRLYLATFGSGPVSRVEINGREWKRFTPSSVELPYADLPEDARILIALGNGKIRDVAFPVAPREDYPAAHRRLVADAKRALEDRKKLQAAGKLPTLEPPARPLRTALMWIRLRNLSAAWRHSSTRTKWHLVYSNFMRLAHTSHHSLHHGHRPWRAELQAKTNRNGMCLQPAGVQAGFCYLSL